jgi:hypothetical protein
LSFPLKPEEKGETDRRAEKKCLLPFLFEDCVFVAEKKKLVRLPSSLSTSALFFRFNLDLSLFRFSFCLHDLAAIPPAPPPRPSRATAPSDWRRDLVGVGFDKLTVGEEKRG